MTNYDLRTETHRESPPSASEKVAKLRLALNHRSLAELEEQGVVKWIKDEQVVTKGPLFDEREREVMDNE